MQKVNCWVRLGGDLNNEVPKKGVTVAEVLLLQAAHGEDAVVKIQPISNKKEPHAEEIERLRELYGLDLFGKVFPGRITTLPRSLPDIGIDRGSLLLEINSRDMDLPVDEDDDEPVKKKRTRRTKAQIEADKKAAAVPQDYSALPPETATEAQALTA